MLFRKTGVLLLVGLWMLFFSTSPVRAQTTGTILGQVSDPSGAAIAGVPVEAENVATGLVHKAVTNADGSYLIPSLPLGTYQVTVEAPGFKTFIQSGISVLVGQNSRVDAKIEIGAITETVSVEADATTVETQSTTVGSTVDNRRLENLPLNGRNVLSLAQLLPGVGRAVITTSAHNIRNGPRMNISGSRESQNNMILDGTSMVELMFNRGINLPNPDALQEFRVLTNTYAAEYGRAAGGVFLAVTKSGTNELHGSAYEYFRNDNLNARNFFAAGKPKLSQNQFGASLGGPLIKNKTFLFGNYQGIRIRQQAVRIFFPPSAAEKQGDFSHLSKAITDPTTGQPFPQSKIPDSRINRFPINFLDAYMPLPNQANGSHLELRSLPTDGNQVSIKGDQILSGADRLGVRFYRFRDVAGNQVNTDNSKLTRTEFGTTLTGAISETHVFSPGVLNEFNFSYLRLDPLWEASPFNRPPSDFGGATRPDGPRPMAPSFNVTGRFLGGAGIWFQEPEDAFEFTEKLSWITGRHSLKFGGELRLLKHVTRAQFVSGTFAHTGQITGDGVADLVLGRPSQYNQQSFLEDLSRSKAYHLFVQDDFKVHRRLTLNLGLRYEVDTRWWQTQGHSAVIRGANDRSLLFPTAPPAILYPGDPGVPKGLVPTDRNNFAPRLGVAWDLRGDGRTSIRAAYGIFYNAIGALFSSLANEAPPYIARIVIPTPPSSSDPFSAGVQNVFPFVFNPQNPKWATPISLGTNVDAGFRDAYIQHFNFNVQRQLGTDLLVQAGYVGQIGRKLAGSRQTNYGVFGPGATLGNIQQRRPFLPQHYSAIWLGTSDVNSHYDSLQVSVNKRYAQGYTLQLAYTWSKSIDTRSADLIGDTAGPQNPDNRTAERGLSDFDQRHILAINGIWELPFFKNVGGLRSQIFAGWQLQGTTRISSGFPFTVLSGRDQALSGTGGQRPDALGNARLDSGRPTGEKVNRYFDTAAFALPALGNWGSASRNPIIGPGSAVTDLGISKRFNLPNERLGRIEFRAEIFNLLNQTTFNNPNATFTSPAFGKILGSLDARVVQFALRYDF